MEFSAQQIAGFLNGTIEGDPNVKVSNFSKIEEGKPGFQTGTTDKSHTCKSRERLCGARDVIKFGRAIEEQKEGG